MLPVADQRGAESYPRIKLLIRGSVWSTIGHRATGLEASKRGSELDGMLQVCFQMWNLFVEAGGWRLHDFTWEMTIIKSFNSLP